MVFVQAHVSVSLKFPLVDFSSAHFTLLCYAYSVALEKTI